MRNEFFQASRASFRGNVKSSHCPDVKAGMVEEKDGLKR